MRASFDALIEGAEDAGLALRSESPGGSALCLGVSCVGWRLVLGQRTDDELDAVTGAMPNETTLVGFYSYGELALGSSGRCELHNQTMTLTMLAES